jgi:hypothetical protein
MNVRIEILTRRGKFTDLEHKGSEYGTVLLYVIPCSLIVRRNPSTLKKKPTRSFEILVPIYPRKQKLTAMGIRCADYATSSIR